MAQNVSSYLFFKKKRILIFAEPRLAKLEKELQKRMKEDIVLNLNFGRGNAAGLIWSHKSAGWITEEFTLSSVS